MINIEKIRDCSTAFFLLKNWPIAMVENIVTALITEADIPAKRAKNQRNKIIKNSLITFPKYFSKNKQEKCLPLINQ